MKDPIDKLRTQCFVKKACLEMRIPSTGYQMEKKLEPWEHAVGAHRSCKYDRYFHNNVTPDPETISLILKEAPQAERVIASPIWEALRVKEKSKNEWIAFFETLSPQLQLKIFDNSAVSTRKTIKSQFRSSTIESIVRKGDLESLACIMGLERYSKVRDVSCLTGTTKIQISQLLATNLINGPLNIVFNEFLVFLSKFFADFFFYPDDPKKSVNFLNKQTTILRLLKELFFISRVFADQPKINDFYYWMYQMDIPALMLDFYLVNNCASLLPTGKGGLLELIEKLNYTRDKNYKLGLGAFINPRDPNTEKLCEEIMHFYCDEINAPNNRLLSHTLPC